MYISTSSDKEPCGAAQTLRLSCVHREVSDSQCASSHRHNDASVQLDPDTHFILLVLLLTCLTTTDTLLTSKEVMVQPVSVCQITKKVIFVV